jgi:3-dehydroquinate synthase
MTPVTRIPVRTKPRAYDVLLGTGVLDRAGSLLRSRLKLRNELIVVVSAENVWKHWGARLTKSLDRAKLRWTHTLIPDGERAKTLSTVESAAEQLTRLGADRTSALIAFGGGVIGDMVGFLAAIYMRGVRVVQIPTTLLAQVDASIGGKTGVNLTTGKNLVGSFHQPQCVLIDPQLLATLDEREFRAGIFEILKCGVIADRSLFESLERDRDRLLAREKKMLERSIEAAVRVKAAIVSKDERESGLRRLLNYGHTIGHALEAETQYKHFLHGEAVAWGMIAAALIGVASGKTSAKDAQRITTAVLQYSPLPVVQSNTHAIVARTASDKKTVGGKNHFIVATAIGRAIVISDVPTDVIARAVDQIKRLSR